MHLLVEFSDLPWLSPVLEGFDVCLCVIYDSVGIGVDNTLVT